MRILVQKAKRTLQVLAGQEVRFSCRIALGREPLGAKTCEGDGRTPEGRYWICLEKEAGKYGHSLGLSYPNPEDAQRALTQGRIDETTYQNIVAAHKEHRRPPWGSPLGGEIYLHEGGTASDWTQGCIALSSDDMDVLWALRGGVDGVEIEP